MEWYCAVDLGRNVRQVVLELDEAPQKPRFGTLWLADHYHLLVSRSRCAGFFRMDRDLGPFLLARADGHVDLLRSCGLDVAYSFYHMPAGGLLGIFLTAQSQEIRLALGTEHVVLECIYGLDEARTVGLLRDAIRCADLHICFADSSTTKVVCVGSDERHYAPECRFDKVFPISGACKRALAEEFDHLLAYHEGLPVSARDFQQSVQQLNRAFPLAVHPVLERASAAAAGSSTEQAGLLSEGSSGFGKECAFCGASVDISAIECPHCKRGAFTHGRHASPDQTKNDRDVFHEVPLDCESFLSGIGALWDRGDWDALMETETRLRSEISLGTPSLQSLLNLALLSHI